MDSSTPRHPIRVVARRTGLTPATLRAWERRYGVVAPARTDSGQRLYSDRDIERLSRLRALTEGGRPIRMVAVLSDEAAGALLVEDRAAGGGGSGESGRARAERSDWVDEAYEAIRALDGGVLERILRRASIALDAPAFLDEVAAPLLARVGAGWAAGEISPAQEHLGSGVLERVLAWLTGPSGGGAGSPRLVVATLQGERHGLGARLVATAAVAEGWGVVYLGTDLPAAEIAATARSVDASAVAISVVSTDRVEETVASLTSLRDLLPARVALIVGGRAAGALAGRRFPAGIEIRRGLEGLRAGLRSLAA